MRNGVKDVERVAVGVFREPSYLHYMVDCNFNPRGFL